MTDNYIPDEEVLTDWLGEAPAPDKLEYLEQQNARCIEIRKKFDDWFYELEGFAFRSERFWDDFDYAKDSKDTQSMVKWLRTAYEVGYNEGQRLYGGTE